jgi:hypothetical protein
MDKKRIVRWFVDWTDGWNGEFHQAIEAKVQAEYSRMYSNPEGGTGDYASAARNDPTPQRDRTGDRSHEGRWQVGQKLAEGSAGRCDQRRALPRRPQPAHDSHKAQAFYVLML